MRLPHRLQGQKVKSQGGAGAYCGGHLAAQLVVEYFYVVFVLFLKVKRSKVKVTGSISGPQRNVPIFRKRIKLRPSNLACT